MNTPITSHDVVGGALTPDPHHKRLTGVFMDNAEELGPAPVGYLVELEVHRWHGGFGPTSVTRTSEQFVVCAVGPPSYRASVAQRR